MDPALKWTFIDFLLNADLYLHAAAAFVNEWRLRNPDAWSILLVVVPPALVWFTMKTPVTWDESWLKKKYDKFGIPWKAGKADDKGEVNGQPES
jgi:hypothetical protein